MEPVWVALITGAGVVLSSAISFAFGRGQARAGANKTDSESESLIATTIKTFQGIYQDLIRDQMVRISRLETEQTASGTRIVGLETLVAEQNKLILSLRAEITLLKEQLVKEGHVPETVGLPED